MIEMNVTIIKNIMINKGVIIYDQSTKIQKSNESIQNRNI